jgi:hypothetical protein
MPTAEQSSTWFRLLAGHFPNSLERFEALIGAGACAEHAPSE